MCWPHCSIFLSCWAISLRALSLGNSLVASNHRALGAATFLWGLVLMWNSEVSCGAQHGQGNEIVGLTAHQPEGLSESQTEGLVFHSSTLMEEKAQVPRTLLTWHDLSNRLLRSFILWRYLYRPFFLRKLVLSFSKLIFSCLSFPGVQKRVFPSHPLFPHL